MQLFTNTSAPIILGLLIMLLPLLGFVINIHTGRLSFTRKHGHVVPLLMIGASAALAIYIFFQTVVVKHDPKLAWFSAEHGFVFSWAAAGDFKITVGMLFDNLTATMLLVVTVVSFLVHLYSVGYMHGDPRYSRFFAYLGIFSFSMLGLVLVDNLLALFIFWELVGVCSYFLIGFWYEQPEPPRAQIKAFMVNRVGDFGFFIGIMLLYKMFGTLSFHEIFLKVGKNEFLAPFAPLAQDPESLKRWLTLAGFLVFCGAISKSAQVPLHVWLPDAMAGPTPVSALIHAATMVAAGVYMVGRMYPIFTDTCLDIITGFGAVTAFIAATMGIVNFDIKKVLAYSTCSQLGYMIMSLGVGGFMAGLFHLTTHAFFKACLFLGSGSVIHAVHSQDMREMGGLRKKLPITYVTFLISTLALAGVPFLSGYFSKDQIVAEAYAYGHGSHSLIGWLPFLLAGVSACMTTFYMGRAVFMTFFGHPHDHHKFDHAHESPPTMTIPLVALCIGAIFAAGTILPWRHAHDTWFGQLVEKPQSQAARAYELAKLSHDMPGVGEAALEARVEARLQASEHAHEHPENAHEVAVGTSMLALAIGSILAIALYLFGWGSPKAIAAKLGPIYTLVSRKYYFDEAYDATAVRGTIFVSRLLRFFDIYVIDFLVNAAGYVTRFLAWVQGTFDRVVVDGLVDFWWHLTHWLSRRFRRLQSGNTRDYLAYALGGMVVVSVILLLA